MRPPIYFSESLKQRNWAMQFLLRVLSQLNESLFQLLHTNYNFQASRSPLRDEKKLKNNKNEEDGAENAAGEIWMNSVRLQLTDHYVNVGFCVEWVILPPTNNLRLIEWLVYSTSAQMAI